MDSNVEKETHFSKEVSQLSCCFLGLAATQATIRRKIFFQHWNWTAISIDELIFCIWNVSHWLIFYRFFPWRCFPILDHSLFFWDFDIKMHGNDNKWYLNQFRWFWSLFSINRKQSPGGALVGKFKKISQKLWYLHYLTRFRGERGIKRSRKLQRIWFWVFFALKLDCI